MTVTLFAQPYNGDVAGFSFETFDDYQQKSNGLKDSFGQPIEEFEIQILDGETIDIELAKAWYVSQANIADFIEAFENWSYEHKQIYIIAVGECSYDHDTVAGDPDSVDLTLYHVRSMSELAEEFVSEGLFGNIPERLQYYIDFAAIGRDLGFDGYTETVIDGDYLIYHCA